MAGIDGAPETGERERWKPAPGAARHWEPARAQTLSLSTVCLLGWGG